MLIHIYYSLFLPSLWFLHLMTCIARRSNQAILKDVPPPSRRWQMNGGFNEQGRGAGRAVLKML